MGLTDFTTDSGGPLTGSNSTSMRVMAVESEVKWGESVIHVFGRDSWNEDWHIEIRGHHASLFVRSDKCNARIENHYAVSRIEDYDENGERYKDLHGNGLTRVYVSNYKQLSDVRELFDDEHTCEADVWYTNRFLIDSGVYTGIDVDLWDARQKGTRHYAVNYSDVEPNNDIEVEPHVVTVDIEVASEGGFPEVEDAEWPVVTIVAHDSLTGSYTGWILERDSWDVSVEEMRQRLSESLSVPFELRSFTDEKQLLTDFNYYVADSGADILTGWYSNTFDWPYLINRSKNLNCYSYRDWSDMGGVWIDSWGGAPRVQGKTMLDMLDGYKKTQIHTLKSGKLDAVAEKVLGRGKLDLHDHCPLPKREIGNIYTWSWKNNPVTLMEYNVRDVEAVVQIEDEKGIIEMFDNMRQLTGSQFSDMIGRNIGMIDMLCLRRASEWGMRLPTNTVPDEDWFFGAYVFDPRAGLHTNVVYPDLSSLYPNMMRQCNMSPETLVGTASDLFMSEYSEEDCVWSWVDTRPVKRIGSDESRHDYTDGTYKAVMKRKSDGGWKKVWADDPEYTKLYYLKPEIKEGFVASLVDETIALKEPYRGTSMYAAVKAVVNSIYGVFGDSNTGGKGFRLFDWRMAESITLGGRKVIQYTAKEEESFLNRKKITENRLGADAFVVGGDTDSAMLSIPFARDEAHALRLAKEAVAHVNASYDDMVGEWFGLEEHHMEVELESYGKKCFFKRDFDSDNEELGKKKRYAQIIHWDDKNGGRWLEEPYINVKGFEMVRGDYSDLTEEAQRKLFTLLMKNKASEARDKFVPWLKEQCRQIRAYEYDWDKLGKPAGIGQELDEYGSKDRKPQPAYRGAKYANQHIYGGATIKSGDKPLVFYVKTRGRHYTADTAEDGQKVDAISVLESDDLPEDVVIDVEKMIDKALRRPLEDIFNTLGWDMEHALRTSQQCTLEPSKGPQGFDASNFM